MGTTACAMGPAGSYLLMCHDLARCFWQQNPVPFEPRTTVRMVGMLFMRPKTAFASTEIVPSLRYYHQRSGQNINFYCAGFSPGWDVSELPEEEFLNYYSDYEFDSFRRDIESRCQWRYSGGADLFLTNALFNDYGGVELDFSSAIAADLIKMKADGAILSVDSFFETIFKYAESQDGKDPTWGFSDQAGKAVAGSALRSLLISLLPKGLQEDAKKAFHFAVADVSN